MKKLQYTIRNIPPAVDKVLRKQAKRTGKSFNAAVVDALMLQTLGSTDAKKASQDVFDRLYGADTLGKEFDQVIKDQSEPDDALWS